MPQLQTDVQVSPREAPLHAHFQNNRKICLMQQHCLKHARGRQALRSRHGTRELWKAASHARRQEKFLWTATSKMAYLEESFPNASPVGQTHKELGRAFLNHFIRFEAIPSTQEIDNELKSKEIRAWDRVSRVSHRLGAGHKMWAPHFVKRSLLNYECCDIKWEVYF